MTSIKQQLISDAARKVQSGANLGDALVDSGETIAALGDWHSSQIDSVLIFADNYELADLFCLVRDKAAGAA